MIIFLALLMGITGCAASEADTDDDTWTDDTWTEGSYGPETETYVFERTGSPEDYVVEWGEAQAYPEDNTAQREYMDQKDSSEVSPEETYAENGRAFWSQIIHDTAEMLSRRTDLPFDASDNTLEEMYDYLRSTGPENLKGESERNLRFQYISIYERLFLFAKAEADVFESIGKALEFADAIAAEQDDLFQMAEDDYENVFGSQRVSAMTALFFEHYLTGFTPKVTNRTTPGNHAVILVYPDNGDPAWEVYFVREQSGSVWKISGSGYQDQSS